MERSTSDDSHRSGRSHHMTSTDLPPWERRAVTQVPFLGASSPSLSNAERRALPDLWAKTSTARERRHQNFSIDRTNSDGGSWPTSPGHYTGSRTAPMPAYPAPYETPLYTPSGPRGAPPGPLRVATNGPPTPPESATNSFTLSSPTTSAENPTQLATALPGTMSTKSQESSRNRSNSSTHGRSTSKQSRTSNHSRAESANFGKRFKSALRDMFHRSPIDESQFERISDRHWTEDA